MANFRNSDIGIENIKKCGEILTFNETTFWFSCSLCQQEISDFPNSDELIQHLKKIHFSPDARPPYPRQQDESHFLKFETKTFSKIKSTKYYESDETQSITSFENDGDIFNDNDRIAKSTADENVVNKDNSNNNNVNDKKKYVCDICFVRFAHKTSLNYHYSSQHTEFKIKCKCKLCPELKYESIDALRLHIIEEHPLERYCYSCYHCHKEWDTSTVLQKHVVNVHTKICRQCDGIFADAHKLSNHRMEEHDTDSEKFMCHKCNDIFENVDLLSDHVDERHLQSKEKDDSKKPKRRRIKPERTKERKIKEKKHSTNLSKCPAQGCGVISHYYTVNRHIREMHPELVPYKCDCGATFTKEMSLEKHKKKHDQLVCKFCKKIFQNVSSRAEHELTHTGQHKNQCELCGKRFIRPNVLRDHVRRHENRKEFECFICGSKFNAPRDLRSHMDAHSTGENYQCDLCPHRARTKKSLGHHKLDKHKRLNFVYKCEMCDKTFTSYGGLYLHKKNNNHHFTKESQS